MTTSAIYAGEVVHARSRPKPHRLRYRVFSLLLDLDELPALSARSRLFGYNRAAIFSFWDRDHGDGQPATLRSWVETQLRDAGLALEHPQISVLCYPRLWGYVFNPLTQYFCSDRDGNLRAILHEVCNTHGERHTYVIPVAPGQSATVRQRARKLHFVSPFMPMDCTYQFLIKPPADRVLVRIDESDPDGPLLFATFSGRRRALTDRALFALLFAYPLMTLKVTAAIHFEAIRLLLKGTPVFHHHKAPHRVARTIVAAAPAAVNGHSRPSTVAE